jgi:ankyrin repeat protein
VVAELLAAGANPRIVDHLMRATPVHKAAYMGHAEVVRLLTVDGGLELYAQGPYNGYTALHDATWHGHAETARVLIEAGARTDLRGLDDRTALEMAHEYGYDEVVGLLARVLPRQQGDRRGS